MKIHHLSPEEALHSLRSHPDGLDVVEVQRRLKEFGRNEVVHVGGVPVYKLFFKGFTHFFAIILFLAAILSFFAEWREPGQGMLILGIAILGVILVNGLFSFWQEYRAEQALAALQQLLPSQVKVIRVGEVLQVVAAELVPGDILLLEEGDHVPADCRVIQSFGLRVNNATVTGESVPKARDEQPCDKEDLMHARNIVLAGTSVVSGQARVVVFATGMHTEFGQIAHLTQSVDEVLSPLQQEIIRLSRVLAVLATVLGVVFFSIGTYMGLPFWANFVFAIGIIVANVPEGLLPTVTLALAMGAQRMARRNVLIRHLSSVETLGTTTVICTDKTGTLTQNRMAVKQLFVSGKLLSIAELSHHVDPQKRDRAFFNCAGLCHNLKVVEGQDQRVGDPMEMALLTMTKEFATDPGRQQMLDEIPFDSDRKRMSMLFAGPEGRVLYAKGALETLLPLCRWVEVEGERQPLSEQYQAALLQVQADMARQGLRVLALASRQVEEGCPHEQLEQDLVLSGLVGLEDPPRPEVREALEKCRTAGIRVIMITGDNPLTAEAIARDIALVQGEHPVVITGDQLRHISNTQLQLALDAPEILFARVTADQKMRVVTALKRKGEVVAVTGDGVNDAPALKKADIGIAMGISGTDVAKQAADMVLVDDNFASIVAAVEEGRAVYQNIRKFLTYILSSNIPEIIPYLAFVLFKIPLPLTIIHILVVDLGTDMLPALGLGVEAPESGVMRQAPRSRKERLLSWPLLFRAYLWLGMMEAVAAMSAFFFVLDAGGWQWGQVLAWNDPLYLQATTACLSAIIVMQVVNVFICRSDHASMFSAGSLANRLILWGVVVELLLILLIDYSPLGNLVFGTAPIAGQVWLFMLPFAIGMVLLEEMRKWLVSRRS